METTRVSVSKTCAEIEEYLIAMDATSIMKDICDGNIEGVAFTVPFKSTSLSIRLPFRWKPIQDLAKSHMTGRNATANEEQARRVAARQVLRWIQAQHALWYCDMVEVAEVFLPYVVDQRTGRTLYQTIETDPGRLLADG